MRSPRTAIAAIVLVASAVVAPLAGVAVANSLRPVIPTAPPKVQAPSQFEPMPTAPSTARSVAHLFESLPIVDPGQDTKARPFLAQYRASAATDPRAMARLVDTAIAEIRVKPADRGVTGEFVSALVFQQPSPPGDGDVSDTEFDTAAFRSLAQRAMKSIASTPTNAGAMNDLAVAIFATSLVASGGGLEPPPGGATFGSYTQLQAAATTLLKLGLASFPDDRAMTINLAFMRSLESSFARQPGSAIPDLQALVDRAPTDVTARSLLANLLLRTDPDHGLDRAITAAQPLLAEADTEAAGQLVLGDAYLLAADVAAETQGESSPFLTRSLAIKGLEAYDQAIGESGDAAAYTGRAVALDRIRAPDAAIAALREAAKRAEPSVAQQLHLAELDACAGHNDDWLADAQAAVRLAGTADATPPARLQFVAIDDPGRGYGGYSIGADRLTTIVGLPDTGGGGALVTIDPFPVPVSCLSTTVDAGVAIDRAVTEAWLAAMAGGDDKAARQVLSTWLKASPPAEDAQDVAAPVELAKVMDLLDGAKFDPDDDPIGAFFDIAARLPPEAKARACSTLLASAGSATDSHDDLVSCVAEAAYRRGDNEAAARAIEPIIRLDDVKDPAPAVVVLQSGMLNELAGHLDIARQRYEAAATNEETMIAGLSRLGDLDLREGDATGALDHYALAIAAIRSQTVGTQDFFIDTALAKPMRQYLDNNRGIALLMTAQARPDTPPDCETHAVICHQAAEAFAAAAKADPLNPVYAMNEAWIARLSGDADRATAKLGEALANGTPLAAAAHNDLGVLAARRGDLDEARSQFVQAVAAEPEYDLATWNLGVLDARQAGPAIVAGQASLADANRLNRDLRSQPMAFQTDERVYRVEVRGVELEVARAPGTGAAVGAAAFGAIATVGAVAQLVSGLGGDSQDAAGTIATEGLAAGTRRLRRAGGRLRVGLRGDRWRMRSWFAWVPAVVVLVVTTAWTAAWMAPDAFATALLIGLGAAALSLTVHACGHLVVAGRVGARLQPAGWLPGIALALVGMPFHVPAGPFLAEQIATGDPRRDWWVSFAGVLANLGAAAIAFVVYLATPMPFLRVLVATQLAVAAFALIPSHPLDGERLATRPVVLALIGLGVAAASTAIALGLV
jgi:tetratricopeptide (TPR) repeat protein/Zn-dependent protease